MDLFEAGCQGVGLALAAGMLAGALCGAIEGGREGVSPVEGFVLTVAGLGAAFMFGASLSAEDHPAWPGWFVGAALAVAAFVVIRSVVAGASARAGEGGSAAMIAGIAALAALVLAALSLTPAAPVSLVVALALLYMGIQRRRRAGEKYEGLRSLR
jgi:hypothetical protein